MAPTRHIQKDCYAVPVFVKHFVLIFFVWWVGEVWGQTNLTYHVQKGDTLTRIATHHRVSLTELIRVNQINPNAILKIGQPLLIPSNAIITQQVGPIISPRVSSTNKPLITNQDELWVTNLYQNPSTLQSNTITSTTTNHVKEEAKSITLSTNSTLSQAASSLTYTVQPGDNLFKIGKQYGVTSEQIAQWNEISLKSVLKIGQKLKLYPSTPPVTEKPLPKVEPLILEKPKVPVTSPVVVTSKPVTTNTTPILAKTNSILTKTNLPQEPIIKVAEVVKPAPKPIPKPEPPPKPAPPPPKKEDKPSSASSSSYVFLQRVKAKIDQPKVERGRWKYIVIHHSGTKQGNAQIFETYHRKVKRMENGLAYHFVIGNGTGSGDGEIEIGGRWTKQLQGGHLYSEYLNTIAIGICFVGDFSKQKPTAKQMAACIELVDYLKKICYSPKIKFCLHREINPRPTDCPGDRFPAALLHRRLD